MWFQKMPIPTTQKVTGNSEMGRGGQKSKISKGKYSDKQESSPGVCVGVGG